MDAAPKTLSTRVWSSNISQTFQGDDREVSGAGSSGQDIS